MIPAFLVDGVTEQRFVKLVCSGSPVRIINCNGSSVRTAAIAKRVASLIRLWGGKFFPIVVVVDLENRDMTAEAFCCDLERAIRDEGVVDDLVVGVADRMIENWMLGDGRVWSECAPPACVDGCHGASVLKRQIPSYDKAAAGPGLLKRASASEIRRRSPSFDAFVAKLVRLNCRWLRA